MKKDIGAVQALYPTPATVVGTVLDGKVNWLLVAHLGIVGYDAVLISMNQRHNSNRGVKEHKSLSVNLVNREMLTAADYVGLHSSKNTDKSAVFPYHMGVLPGAPLIDDAPVSMECELVHSFEYEGIDEFVLKVTHTHVMEEYLDEKGHINYTKVRPILFDMQNKQYLSIGEHVGKCWNIGKNFKK